MIYVHYGLIQLSEKIF